MDTVSCAPLWLNLGTPLRAKLLSQQVNSLLIDFDNLNDEDFILPKSLYLCMIRFEASENMSKEWNMLTSNNKVCTRRHGGGGGEWCHHQMKKTQDGTIFPFRFGLTARKSKIEIGAECVCVLQIRQINTIWIP